MYLKDFIKQRKAFIIPAIIIYLIWIIYLLFNVNDISSLIFLIIVTTIPILAILFLLYINFHSWREYFNVSGRDTSKIPHFPKTHEDPPKESWGQELLRVETVRFHENCFFGEFTFSTHRLFGFEFRFYSDIQYICRFEYDYGLNITKRGIHIETVDKKILNIFINKPDIESEINSILNLLKNKTGSKWNEIFDKNYVITNGFQCFDNLYEIRLKNNEKTLSTEI